ncbi:hypothetical protein [Streptosporangium sp. NPDC004631]
MSAPSRTPAVIDALTVRFTAAIAAAAGMERVRVLDGPAVTAETDTELVYVGWDGDPDGDGQAVEATQDWAGIGARARDETLQVTCSVIVWSGDTAMRPRRDRCYAILGVLEAALRADPSLGLPPPTVAALAAGNLWQAQTSAGAEVRVVFAVAVKTRI